MLNHFSSHKQKYVGFVVVALLVICAARVITSEAQVDPYGMLANGNVSIPENCPPFFRHLRFLPPVLLRHPCFLFSQTENPTTVPPVPSDTTPAPSVTDASSTATTTDTTTEDMASSTATTTEDMATSTDSTIAPESTTTPASTSTATDVGVEASTTQDTTVAQ